MMQGACCKGKPYHLGVPVTLFPLMSKGERNLEKSKGEKYMQDATYLVLLGVLTSMTKREIVE